MKKNYSNPNMTVVRLQHQGLLMQSVQSFSSNLTDSDAIGYGGGSSGSARTKESGNIWDDEW